jgi:hypothetical protein
MSYFEDVTVKNALLYAMKAYDNPQCLTQAEFVEDFKRFKYVKRLCSRYLATGKVSERLMLNHLMLLRNVFGQEAMIRLLFLKCNDPKLYRVLKPFLVYMDALPDVVVGVNGVDIYTYAIPTDERLWGNLQTM